MRRRRRLLATIMVAALVLTAMPHAPVCAEEKVIADVPDLTDAQAGELVKKAFEKYYKHTAVGFLLEQTDANSFYAYDSVSDIGVVSLEMAPDALPVSEAGLQYQLNDWYDFKNALLYETYYGVNDNKIETSYYPMDEEECELFKKRYFDEILLMKERSFPEALEYYYDGKTWEYGPDQEAHICYKIGVPESDASLYLQGEDYLPKMIYVGVEDGELYRIDEERFATSDMTTVTYIFYTHFYYPDTIGVPDELKKKAKLDYEYCPVYKKVDYFQIISGYDRKKIGLVAYQINEGEENVKKIVIPDQIDVRGIKYRVEEIGTSAFSGEISIKKVTIGNYVHRIRAEAFYGCKKLKTVTIGKRIKQIGRDAFSHCKKLKMIRIKNKKMRKYVNSQKGRKKLGIRKQVKVKG